MSTEDSLVAQVEALYAEREELEKALGTADAESLVAHVRALETTIANLVAQVEALYAEREDVLAAAAA